MGNIYIGNSGIARKVNKVYVGVNGVARQVKKIYVGVNGIAREVYSSGISPIIGSFTESYVVPQNTSTNTNDWGRLLATASDYASKVAQGATNFELILTVTIKSAREDGFQLSIGQYNKATMPSAFYDVSAINQNSYGYTEGFITGITKSIHYTKALNNMSNGLMFTIATNDYWGDTVTITCNYEIHFT